MLAFSHSLTPTFIIELLPIKYPPTRPSPRQGRRLGPPEVWNLLCHGHGLHIVQGRSCNKCLSVFKRFAKLQRPHLPAHSPLLLRHSSLPFARLQTLKTLKTLKTLQFPRGSFHQALWPSASAVPALQPALCLHIALCCWGIQASAATKPFGRQPLLFQGCSLPFGCTSLAAASTKLLALSVPALQPALCLHIALSC